MLNAFRHLRKEHLHSEPLRRKGQCAQRLSASTEGTQPRGSPPATRRVCAQRLSASTEGTQWRSREYVWRFGECSTPFGIYGRNTEVGPRRLEFRRDVLNAFRHLRKEHLAECPRIGVASEVLNAFRHLRKEHSPTARIVSATSVCAQRLSASTEGTHARLAPRLRQLHLCSTPVGIYGRNTTRPRCGSPPAGVLNAFRHLRKEHPSPPASGPAPCVACSTPFGIYGRNTHLIPVGTGLVCSCSTRFGIYGRNTAVVRRHVAWVFGAQRLSASTEGTPTS